jgi:hypothetical protein
MSDALVFRVVDVSFGHLTKRTRRLVSENACDGRDFFAWSDEGRVMSTARHGEDEGRVPPDLEMVWDWAATHNADYIKFDADGRQYAELPWYGDDAVSFPWEGEDART